MTQKRWICTKCTNWFKAIASPNNPPNYPFCKTAVYVDSEEAYKKYRNEVMFSVGTYAAAAERGRETQQTLKGMKKQRLAANCKVILDGSA